MASAGKIEISLVAEVARFRADFAAFGRELTGGIEGMKRSIEGLGGAFDLVGEAARIFGLAISAEKIFEFVKGAVEATKEISALSAQMGLSTKTVQVMKVAASETGVEFEVMRNGVEKLARNVEAARQGNKQAIDGFKALGVGVNDAAGNARQFEDIVHEVASRIDEIEDPVKKGAAAFQEFGRNGQQMLPAMHALGDGWTELQEKAQQYGLVVPDSVIEADKRILEDFDRISTELMVDAATWAASWEGSIGQMVDLLHNLKNAIDGLPNKLPAWVNFLLQPRQFTPSMVDLSHQGYDINKYHDPFGQPIPVKPGSIADSVLGFFTGKGTSAALPPGGSHPYSYDPLSGLRPPSLDQMGFISTPGPATGFGESNPAYATGGARNAAADAAKREADAVARVVEQLNFEAKTAGMDADTLKLENALRQAGTDISTAYGQQILKAWQNEVKAADSARQAADAQRRLNAERSSATAIVERFKTPMAKLIEDYRTLNQALKDGAIKQQEWADGTKGVLAAQKQLDDQTQKLNQDIAETAKTIGSDLGSALADGVTGAKTWKEAMTDAIKSIVQELAKLALKLAEKPLEDFIGQMLGTSPTTITGAGGMEPSAGGYVHGISGITASGAQAGGHIGGASIVGEYGPEIFVPDTPGMVLNNDTLMHGFGRGGGTHYHVDARGAELGVEARVMAALRELHRSIEPRAVAAVEVSRRRGGAFAQNFRR